MNALTGCALVVLLLVSCIVDVSSEAFVLVAVALALASICGFIDEHRRIAFGEKQGSLDQYGKLIWFCAYPRPGTSMLDVLSSKCGIDPWDIEQIKLQTCTFGNPYLKQLSDYFTQAKVPSTVDVEIIGVGSTHDANGLAKAYPNAHLLESSHKLKRHFNLIKAKGIYYLWYEPYHNDTGGARYVPSKGAFLVEVTDSDKALRRFYRDAIRELDSASLI